MLSYFTLPRAWRSAGWQMGCSNQECLYLYRILFVIDAVTIAGKVDSYV